MTRYLKQTTTFKNSKGEEETISKSFPTTLSNCGIAKRLHMIPSVNQIELKRSLRTEFEERGASYVFEIVDSVQNEVEKPVA